VTRDSQLWADLVLGLCEGLSDDEDLGELLTDSNTTAPLVRERPPTKATIEASNLESPGRADRQAGATAKNAAASLHGSATGTNCTCTGTWRTVGGKSACYFLRNRFPERCYANVCNLTLLRGCRHKAQLERL